MKDINLGIVGTNFVSDWMAESVMKTKGITAFSVCSRKEETGKIFAEKHGIKNVFSNFESFLKSGIDAVYTASPNLLHFSHGEAILKNGLHLFLEKPATVTKSEFEQLLSLAKEKNLVVLEAMRPVFDPALSNIEKVLSKSGKIKKVHLEYCQRSSRLDAFLEGTVLNAFNPKMKNSALLDLGCYALSVCTYLFSAPKSIKASCKKLSNGFEASGCAYLSYDGFDAEICWSKLEDSNELSYIETEKGTIYLGKPSTLDEVFFIDKDGVKTDLTAPTDGLNMIYETESFVKMVNGKQESEKYNKLSLLNLEIMDEIRLLCDITF